MVVIKRLRLNTLVYIPNTNMNKGVFCEINKVNEINEITTLCGSTTSCPASNPPILLH